MAKPQQFVPRNPAKYMGNPRNIVARSSWELLLMHRLDTAPGVTKWISEPKTLNITYICPIDKKMHQYWPDFIIQYATNEIEIIEIKPAKEAIARNAVSVRDKLMLIRNVAKWKAGARLAKAMGGRFRVLTENELFGVNTNKRPSKPRTARAAKGTQGTR